MTVGKAAALAGVTIRTLHHYEQVGLLVPSGRSAAGYRIYTDADCDRLARILYYRELGFSLDNIRTMLNDADPFAHLERQHRLLLDRLARVQRMVTALEREMEAHQMNYNLTPEEKLDVFGDFDPSAHEPCQPLHETGLAANQGRDGRSQHPDGRRNAGR
jgi:DNA-binding transcriptional MerR regulator